MHHKHQLGKNKKKWLAQRTIMVYIIELCGMKKKERKRDEVEERSLFAEWCEASDVPAFVDSVERLQKQNDMTAKRSKTYLNHSQSTKDTGGPGQQSRQQPNEQGRAASEHDLE